MDGVQSKLKMFIEKYQGKVQEMSVTINDLTHKNSVLEQTLTENGIPLPDYTESMCESEIAENLLDSNRSKIP